MSRGDLPRGIELELFIHRFAAIAEQMGEQLRRTALSTNVKERLDFSCALLSPEGRLVVNAPHIPVHLGAMGLCVRRLIDELSLGPGDVVVTNHPAYGGSHLPDVTMVSPVHHEEGGEVELIGFVASRAHHAEIGGKRPGSMPPDAICLAEEGVVIPPTLVVEGGVPHWDRIRDLLGDGPWPSRAPEENLADLRAALAAGQRGETALLNLAAEHGKAVLARNMEALEEHAARCLGVALEALGNGSYEAEELLDDGTPLKVCLRIEGDRAEIDFSGTGAVHPGNLNATPAVVNGVVLYVLRLLAGRELPLNEGLFRRVTIVLPECLLNPPFHSDPSVAPAVVGGNVETSQRLTDTLLKALGLVACSQGTMNNLLFGTESFGYYETICGGSGAGPGFAGVSAVHTHMTNTRITDPEVLEHRFPVRLESFAIRRGSGGGGRYPGGDGVRREIRFLEPMDVSLLTQHRKQGPYGMAGGQAGQEGRQFLRRADGSVQPLAAIDGIAVEPGDALVLETPGGGGWGELSDRSDEGAGCGTETQDAGEDEEGDRQDQERKSQEEQRPDHDRR